MNAHHPNTPARPRKRVTLGCPSCGSGIHLALLTSPDSAVGLRIERVVVHRAVVQLHVFPARVPLRVTRATSPTLICTACTWCAADGDWTGALVPLGE